MASNPVTLSKCAEFSHWIVCSKGILWTRRNKTDSVAIDLLSNACEVTPAISGDRNFADLNTEVKCCFIEGSVGCI